MSSLERGDASCPGDFAPTASLEMLRLRAELLRKLRSFFDQRGFLEVQTPLLSADTTVDLHLEPLSVVLDDQARWLQTSPEFAMKRLLAAGAKCVYQITQAFRDGERGPRHNTEFTILEWYRVGDDYAEGRQLLAEFVAAMALGDVRELSYADAFAQYAGVDPHRASASELALAATRSGVHPGPSFGDDRDAWLDLLLVACVEPRMGRQPTIVYDYPASQAALARLREDDPPVAERFELYVDGVELANGYHELRDAAALRDRQQETNRRRRRRGKRELPQESRLLKAMEFGLPPCVGAALGVDRLLMVQTGAASIDQVIAFPFERA